MLKRIVKFCTYLIRANPDPPHLVSPQNFVLSKLLNSFFYQTSSASVPQKTVSAGIDRWRQGFAELASSSGFHMCELGFE